MSTVVLDPILDVIDDVSSELDFEEPVVSHMITKEDALNGYINGVAVTALCGHVFVPTRDPERYPLCQKCSEIARNGFYDGGSND